MKFDRPYLFYSILYIIHVGSNGSASHPVGHSFHLLPHPGQGITQPGITQPGVTQPGFMTQRRVVQRRAPQLYNAPQHMTAGFQISHSEFYAILSKSLIFICMILL